MGKDSKIKWCDHTFNPWIGCQKVGPGCDNCYAEALNNRFGWVTSGTGCACDPVEETPFWGGRVRVRTAKANWRQPLNWNRKAKIAIDAWEKFKAENPGMTDEQLEAQGFVKPRRPRVFCGSLCDVFDNAVPDKWRQDLFDLICDTTSLTWLLLTKRIGNAEKMIRETLDACGFNWKALKNVQLGITICNQAEADRDIPKLFAIPAEKRFLSIEPMLGQIDLNLGWNNDIWREDCKGNRLPPRRIDHVIVGGETGHHARPMHPNWVRSIRDQCETDVPFFFKGWGEWGSAKGISFDTFVKWEFEEEGHPSELSLSRCKRKPLKGYVFSDLYQTIRVGKKRSGRLLDGVLHDQFPK